MRATVIALAAGLAALPAFAQKVNQPVTYSGNLAGFSGDPAALPRAISAIEAQGARVMEIRYDGSNGPGYVAVLARNGNVEFQRAAEPATGLTAISSSTQPTWMLDWRGRDEVKAVRKARVDLATAVRTAEGEANGAPAVAAGIAASSAGQELKAYNVLVHMPDGVFRRVMVDADSGAPIANPGALRNWP